jgi:hypothetical protein
MANPRADYDLTYDDAVAFFADALPRAPLTRRQLRNTRILTSVMVAGAGLALFSYLDGGFPPSPVHLAVTAVGVAAALWFSPGSLHKAQMRRVRRLFEEEGQRQRLGPTTIELRPDGVAAASPLGASLLAWAGVTEIVARPDYLFLHLNSLSALIVPRRAFADAAGFERFAEAARLFKRNATGGEEEREGGA